MGDLNSPSQKGRQNDPMLSIPGEDSEILSNLFIN